MTVKELMFKMLGGRAPLPRVCPGSSQPADLGAYVSSTGTGACGICGQLVRVGPYGHARTHPYPEARL